MGRDGRVLGAAGEQVSLDLSDEDRAVDAAVEKLLGWPSDGTGGVAAGSGGQVTVTAFGPLSRYAGRGLG